jgi:hypothetical protein
VAFSDRDVTFANHCARLLKARYPDKDYTVSMNAYGNSRPAPLKAVPEDNVVISNVANMFWSLDAKDKDSLSGKTYASHYADWGKLTENQVWRPNTGNPAGWQNGLPDVPIARIIQSFRFAVDHHCIGIIVDSVWEHWATQGPLYYVLAHMAWDPSKDWRAVMDDYYCRGFGPASAEIKAYWALLEESCNRKVDDYPGEANGYDEVYNQAFFDKAYGLLDQAASKATGAPEKYRQRIEFVRVGLEHTKLASELRQLSRQMLQNGLEDTKTADLVRAKWDEVQKNADRVPHAIYWPTIRPGKRMVRGGLFHPSQMTSMKPKQLTAWRTAAAQQPGGEPIALQAAGQAGWELVFSDEFDRQELGKDWKAVEGIWKVDEGALRGSGTLISARAFPEGGAPGYLRMEFEAIPDVKGSDPLGAGDKTPGRISDMSAVLHVKDTGGKGDTLRTGYFFQFGGRWNKLNQISRAGEALVVDGKPNVRIESDKVRKIVVENDNGRLSMFVDGRNVLTGRETASLLGDGHDRVGFFFYTAAKVLNVKVYVKRLSSGLDVDPDEAPRGNETRK